MSDSLRLSVPDLTDPARARQFFGVATAALDADGYDPFNEQARLDIQSGHRMPRILAARDASGTESTVGAAITGEHRLDLVIDPAFRGRGFGDLAAGMLLEAGGGRLTAWSHGDHPAARSIAAHFGFTATRTLLRLRLPNLDATVRSIGSSDDRPEAITIGPFEQGRDEGEWVSLNARIFAEHPEQGKTTIDDLRARESEDWFVATDFLVARDEAGRMVGYNWLKIEPESREGEIYVVGVAAGHAGKGLGRRLMNAGLESLAERGCDEAVLYVEADNLPAVHLYRSLGFTDDTVDVQYSRADPTP